MRVLINVEHPAHVHFFKHFAWEMIKRGHEIRISAFDKEVTLDLLKAYGFEYDLCGKQRHGVLGAMRQLIEREWGVYRVARKSKLDVIVGIGDIAGPHVSKITKARSVVFSDTEHARLGNLLSFSFADVVCTPSCFEKSLGGKQVRYEGYHELAYLHPKRFTPNPMVLSHFGLTDKDRFVIVRFVSWSAAHDIRQHGVVDRRRLVAELERYGRVLITSEKRLEGDLEKYCIRVHPERLHDLLYYATLYIGEGATTASECAVLGTPAIYVNTLKLGYLNEQEEKYGLVYNFSNPRRGEEEVMEVALQLLKDNNSKNDAREKAKRLLDDKIDVTEFMVRFVEDYPRSLK